MSCEFAGRSRARGGATNADRDSSEGGRKIPRCPCRLPMEVTVELREFITTTLVEIQRGVQEAINTVGRDAVTGAINPVFERVSNVGRADITAVQFDIAVSVSDRKAGAGEGAIKVFALSLGGNAEQEKETSHVSRIRFSIPVLPPATIVVRREGR